LLGRLRKLFLSEVDTGHGRQKKGSTNSELESRVKSGLSLVLSCIQQRATLLILRQLLHKFQLALPAHSFIFLLRICGRFQEFSLLNSSPLMRYGEERPDMSYWFSRLRSTPLFRQYGWYIVGVPTLAGLIYMNNKV